MPGLRVFRWSSDAPHVGLKEAYTIARVESGYSDWSSGRQRWTSVPGSLQILTPGDVCRDQPRGTSTRQVVTIAASVVESIVGKVRIQRQVAPDDERGLPFQRLHDAVWEGAGGIAVEAAVVEAIDALGNAQPLHSARPTRAVQRALTVLHERLSESISLDLLAEQADRDKFHLCREFRAQVGMSPHAYQTRVRVWRAKELLTLGMKPTEVAARVGFYDQSQLNRHFRRYVGTTPARYARSH